MTQPAQYPAGVAACVRHPDRTTRLSCARCGRPACPDCLREASVGSQCVDCVAASVPRKAPRRAPGTRAVVVPTLVALNLAVFAWTVMQAHSLLDNAESALFHAWALVPADVAGGEWWRLFTAGFLHIGPLHIAFNMYALWVLGRDLEIVLGRARFLALYLISLLGGSAAVVLFADPQQYVAGASGAVFGLMSGLLLVLLRLRRHYGQVVAVIVLNLVISQVVPGISIAGHVGGLVVGALAAAALVFAPARRRTLIQTAALLGLTVVLLAAIAVHLASA
ncbi:MAG: rhomboid family intramembrane serine protease [Pseudonocardiales bacterium]|nr:rhomboid family intramembrane serine protease [Pseudonocardiales bacterium]